MTPHVDSDSTMQQAPNQNQTAHTSNHQASSVMESELKSLQSKIMDLENKLSFTNQEETNVDEELLKSGIMLQQDPFQSIDERQEFSKAAKDRKASFASGSTDKARKIVHTNFTSKQASNTKVVQRSSSDMPEYSRRQQHQVPSANIVRANSTKIPNITASKAKKPSVEDKK